MALAVKGHELALLPGESPLQPGEYVGPSSGRTHPPRLCSPLWPPPPRPPCSPRASPQSRAQASPVSFNKLSFSTALGLLNHFQEEWRRRRERVAWGPTAQGAPALDALTPPQPQPGPALRGLPTLPGRAQGFFKARRRGHGLGGATEDAQGKTLPRPRPPAPRSVGRETRTPEGDFTGLMSVQVLAGDVVVNHIFLQGGESKPLDWERRERRRARARLWRPRREAAAGVTPGLHQLAAPSRPHPRGSAGPASCSPAPGEPRPATALRGPGSAASSRPPAPPRRPPSDRSTLHPPPGHPQAGPSGRWHLQGA